MVETGNDSSGFGDVRHGSNGIVSFSWFGLLVICWCSTDGSLFDDVDGCIGVKNDDDGDDEFWIDGKVESKSKKLDWIFLIKINY